jgi:hypothetical protein
LRTPFTGEQYVTEQGWLKASLTCCPLHPAGGCGFARHGSYARKRPWGARIARWYCPLGHRTFSLIPDCLAARWSGTLQTVEVAVMTAETAPSLVAAARILRPDIEEAGAVRWVRRRKDAVDDGLHRLRGLLPDLLTDCAPTLTACQTALGQTPLLPALREIAAPWLDQLPPPFGFAHRCSGGVSTSPSRQHSMGPDPPGSGA